MKIEDWEYSLWVILNPTGDSAIRIEQVNISASTAALPAERAFRNFQLCAVITLDASQTKALQADIQYTEAWQKGGIGVFFPTHKTIYIPSASLWLPSACPRSQHAAFQASIFCPEGSGGGLSGCGKVLPCSELLNDTGDRSTYAYGSDTIQSTSYLLVRRAFLIDFPWRM